MPRAPAAVDLGFFKVVPAEPILQSVEAQAPAVGQQIESDSTPVAPETPARSVLTTSQSIKTGPEALVEQFAPTVDEITQDEITKLAQAAWPEMVAETSADDAATVSKVWNQHLQGSQFSLRKVMLLEYSQFLEKFLWPTFIAKSKKGKSKSALDHVLSIVVLVNEKFRQRIVGVWDIFGGDASRFSGLVSRILELLISSNSEMHDGQIHLDLELRRFLLIFLINMFQSLEHPLVRAECLRLVNIAMWDCVVERRRERELNMYPERRALWEKAEAKFDATTKAAAKEKMRFDRAFFSTLIKSFFNVLSSVPEDGPPPVDVVLYCERFLELLIDLEAQLPTRRHFNLLLHDHLVVPICDSSNLAKRGRNVLSQTRDISLAKASGGELGSGMLFVQLLDRLHFYARFEINDFTGAALTLAETSRLHYGNLRRLQKIAFIKFRDTLEDFALTNIGSIESKRSFRRCFEKVEETTIRALCAEVGIRTHPFDADDDRPFSKAFMIDLLAAMYAKRPSQIDAINALSLYPDENALFDETAVPASQQFSNTHCLAIPKLNLQYLTIHDYLLRNFTLFRLESTYEIRQDIEDVVHRLQPRHNVDRSSGDDETVFGGWARMASPIDNFQIVDVGPPRLGANRPSFVKADVTINIQKFTDSIRREWESLKSHDIMFLLTIRMEPAEPGWAQFEAQKEKQAGETPVTNFRRKFGLKYVRGCEISDLLGDDSHPVEDFTSAKNSSDGGRPRVTGFRRRFRLLLDPNQYQSDMDAVERKEEDVYPTFNVLVRRKSQENNFKAVLGTIRDLMQSDLVVPDWLHNVFLGYGDRNSAHYTSIPQPVRTLDFQDTFLDWEHLSESFPGKRLIRGPDGGEDISPPYVLTFPKSTFEALSGEGGSNVQATVSSGVKRKLDAVDDDLDEGDDAILVRTYTPVNNGPYPEDLPKKNAVRFTVTQVEAIHAGTSPGLTLVVGPPGTGKTDVAVQIISNLYHNYPEQNTLIITHSNTALNQLFEKIAALDIDPRHILRLGHGQEDLDLADANSWGKYGRVNAFLEKRVQLLGEVDRLAQCLEIPGAHGYTCETAGYFYTYHVKSLWDPYIRRLYQLRDKAAEEREDVFSLFPFQAFFADAPQPLLPDDATYDERLETLEGCWRHIQNVFDELEEIRAFELLRSGYDRSNYLLVKEAKIIAMTCTHAALKRKEFVRLGFKYDSVVMEEAGQILEVETFIPLLLQNPDPDTGASRLKRVVMIGDHNQLPPVVKNMAFQRYGNMEQSLFARFVRLGVPVIQLDAQGRSRSSLAELFRWKYQNLKDLPNVQERPEFNLGNPGFAFDYQVINVPNFMGQGETEPRPHFVQNLGEAEYVVATYQYMRLLGYPAERISILTTYNGQKELIRDVLETRCAWNPLFGNPHRVATVDKYQGQQNDYVLLSLVRTKTVGHLRDVRRLIVAMSRARLGLYVFCRVPLFQGSYELQPVFKTLLQRPTDALWLRNGESYVDGTFTRTVDETAVVEHPKKGWRPEPHAKGEVAKIEDVQHMGEYVADMVKQQIEYLRKQKEAAAPVDGASEEVKEDAGGDEDAMEGVEVEVAAS
ncbi:uncharacterized protein EV422DRAFT_602692 [Fimicolochytrium jonesii]|uniref:uncharacterized protein n=1 Tax=Fimicolochytrium jonesii TaxID=1396493 RepID=UPI0022FF25F2|nr:uncharacterized protein EV422DRAFT_602692 [Fimicolochytrium jonesii]KAI8818102.1 hypothetical protein EV422DRAFT_602692 [Fimicolochytrium jonesii]